MLVMTSPDPPSRFLRAHDDRVLGGVAGGLGRAFGVDAVIFRIVLAALVFAGGIGLLIYGAVVVFVPSDDGTGNPAPRERSVKNAAAIAGGGLLVVGACVVAGSGGAWDGGWLFGLAVVTGLGYLVVRRRGGLAALQRDRPPLARLLIIAGIGTALLLGAALAFWGSAWATAAGAGVAVAAIVLALGVALIVGALRGNVQVRWLALPALIIAFPAGVVSAADISLDGGVGERTYRPAGADRLPAGYELGAGEIVVDLRGLDWSGGRRAALDLDVGVGHAVVIVPETVCVGARSTVGAGYADVFGRDAGGVDVDHDVTREPAPGAPGLTLDVKIGMGVFEVLHRSVNVDRGADGSRSDGFGFEQSSSERRTAGRIADRACAQGRS